MRIKRKAAPAFSDSGAASDLAFLLIIYFLVISDFNVNLGFLVDLPARDSAIVVLREDLLRFELDGAGNIIYGEAVIEMPLAASLIENARSGNPNLAVVLNIDPQAQWQNVVSFVELAQELDIETFSFSIMPAAGGAQP
ncbi:MAG: biopolymer transporter ExbD [Spirochaetes bacterium]|nr:biopolymer transporter ExbD [Spirochaetota bacterium]